MLALCERSGLARPLCNLEVEGYTVDFVWPQASPLRVTWRRLTDEPAELAEQLRQLLA